MIFGAKSDVLIIVQPCGDVGIFLWGFVIIAVFGANSVVG